MDTNTITNTVTLIGYGLAPAVQAQDLQIGQITVWNYGFKYEVVELTPKAKTQIIAKIVNVDTGIEYTKTMSRTRLVAVKVTL